MVNSSSSIAPLPDEVADKVPRLPSVKRAARYELYFTKGSLTIGISARPIAQSLVLI